MPLESSWTLVHLRRNDSLTNQQHTLEQNRPQLGGCEAVAAVSRMVPGAEKAADCRSVPSCFGVYDLFQTWLDFLGGKWTRQDAGVGGRQNMAEALSF